MQSISGLNSNCCYFLFRFLFLTLEINFKKTRPGLGVGGWARQPLGILHRKDLMPVAKTPESLSHPYTAAPQPVQDDQRPGLTWQSYPSLRSQALRSSTERSHDQILGNQQQIYWTSVYEVPVGPVIKPPLSPTLTPGFQGRSGQRGWSKLVSKPGPGFETHRPRISSAARFPLRGSLRPAASSHRRGAARSPQGECWSSDKAPPLPHSNTWVLGSEWLEREV